MVVDRKLNTNADTGMFELAYKQQIPATPPYTGQNLIVRGIKLRAAGAAQHYKTGKLCKRNFKFSAIVTTKSIKKVNAKSPTDPANLAKLPRINIPKTKWEKSRYAFQFKSISTRKSPESNILINTDVKRKLQ